MVVFAIGGVTLSTWGPRLASVRDDLGVGDGGIGLVLAGVTVGSVTGLAASSALLARLGARAAIRSMLRAVAAGLVLVAVGAGAAGSVALTAAGFVVVGLGIGAVDVMINVEGAAIEREAGRTLMPLMHAAWSAGAVLGAGIGAGSAAVGLAFGWQFAGEALLVAVVAGVAARSIPVREHRGDGGVGTAPVVQPSRAGRLRRWLSSWAEPRLLLIGVVMLGVELGEGTANGWLTLAVHDGHGRPEAVAALYFVAFAVGETLARVAAGPLVDRFGRVAAVRATTALGVVGTVAFITADTGALVLAGTVLWAVGVSMGFPLGMSAAAESGPDPAARVSVVASVGYLANLAGPAAIGALSQALGVLSALWLVAALLGVALAGADALRTRPTAGSGGPEPVGPTSPRPPG